MRFLKNSSTARPDRNIPPVYIYGDILFCIFSFLKPHELMPVFLVSRLFFQKANDVLISQAKQNTLWKLICESNKNNAPYQLELNQSYAKFKSPQCYLIINSLAINVMKKKYNTANPSPKKLLEILLLPEYTDNGYNSALFYAQGSCNPSKIFNMFIPNRTSALDIAKERIHHHGGSAYIFHLTISPEQAFNLYARFYSEDTTSEEKAQLAKKIHSLINSAVVLKLTSCFNLITQTHKKLPSKANDNSSIEDWDQFTDSCYNLLSR